MSFKNLKNFLVIVAVYTVILTTSGCGFFFDLPIFDENIKDDDDQNKTPKVGLSYQGGVIFYILEPTDIGYIEGEIHGLIAAHADQSTGIRWSDTAICPKTDAIGTKIGTGQANTDLIVYAQGDGDYAAKLCYDYVNADKGTGVYYDWYLPSRDELDILQWNESVVGGVYCSFYWSSTEHSHEYSINYASSQLFITGTQEYNQKYNKLMRVRAIRSF